MLQSLRLRWEWEETWWEWWEWQEEWQIRTEFLNNPSVPFGNMGITGGEDGIRDHRN